MVETITYRGNGDCWDKIFDSLTHCNNIHARALEAYVRIILSIHNIIVVFCRFKLFSTLHLNWH